MLTATVIATASVPTQMPRLSVMARSVHSLDNFHKMSRDTQSWEPRNGEPPHEGAEMAGEGQNDEGNENDGAGDGAEGTGKPGTAAGSNGDGNGTDDDGNGDGGSGTGAPDHKADADKWKKLSRQNETNLRAAQKKIQDFEDKALTDSQRLEKERDSYKDSAETASSQLKYMNVAIEHAPEHATLAQLRKVAKRLRGDSDDDLEADAKELWADFAPTPSSKTPPTAGKPKERLKGGGADPDSEPDEMDPAKIVASIPRAR